MSKFLRIRKENNRMMNCSFIRCRCCRKNQLKEREIYLKETLHRQYKELGSLRYKIHLSVIDDFAFGLDGMKEWLF